MAGEITQQAITLALGGAGIGAGGAVAAQIVAAIFTGKREQKRADAEATRWEAESEAKRRDRNLDHKTELFVKFLTSLEAVHKTDVFRKDTDNHTMVSQMAQSRLINEGVEEIGLIAPEVYRHARKASLVVSNYIFAKMKLGDSDDPTPAQQLEVYRGYDLVKGWIELNRNAVRLYIAHKPIEWPELEIAKLNETVQKMEFNPRWVRQKDVDN